jgi:hypothetical protein
MRGGLWESMSMGGRDIYLDQSGRGIAVRGKGFLFLMNHDLTRFFCVAFHSVKAQEAQEMHICPKFRGLQTANVYAVG